MTSQRGTLSSKKISDELALGLNQAAKLMQQKKQPVMTAEILLLAFILTPNTDAHQTLRSLSYRYEFNWDALERDTDRAASDRRSVRDEAFDFVTGDGKRVALSQEILIVLDDGLSLAEQENLAQCSSSQVLAAMASIQIGTHWLLNKRGLTQRVIKDELTYPHSTASQEVSVKTKTQVSTTIYPRKDLEEKLINLLSMRSSRNVILVGGDGVGKRSLVLGVGYLIAQGKGPFGIRSIVELDEHQLLENPQQAVRGGIQQARGGILFVPDIDRFFGGIRAEFREEAGAELQKAFLANNVVIIGTATEDAFSKKLKSVRVVVEHSQILRVPPAQVNETVEILKIIKPRFESDYDLAIQEQSLIEAARLAGRYYTVKPLPGAAVDLLHRACALVKTGGPTEANKISQLTPNDVMKTTSMLTGIPVNTMGADERDRYINMEKLLKEHIIGQDEAVAALSRAVKMARVGLKDPKRPIGSFMFLGPTGVGKSELAKVLAEFMFGTERALITLDMSEYMDASSVNRLIGSPPGYVGHESGGQLTDAVKKQPYSVVLFDEVEKANRQVFDTLLQVLDEGRLTSGQGETVSFSECVILMTSNIGGEYLADVRMSEDIGLSTDSEQNGSQPSYNQKNIARLLNEGFNTTELLTLFGSMLDFSGESPAGQVDLPDEAANKKDNARDTKVNLITLLIMEAEKKSQFDQILEIAAGHNPAKFDECEPYYNWPVACLRAEKALKTHFRPEFLNRLDSIIYFHPLNDSHLRQILGLMLNQERKLLQNQGLDLDVTGAAKSWIIDQNEHPEWGARPLRRLIQNHIREEIAEFILRENPSPGQILKVQVQGGVLKFSASKA